MERSAELKDAYLRSFEALAHDNAAFVERHISHRDGVLAIGTDPAEWWDDHASIVQGFEEAAAGKEGAQVSVVPGDPTAFQEGSVGWVADRPVYRVSDGNEIQARVTVIFHLEAGEWKIVQQHWSMGVPNEQVITLGTTGA